MEKNDFIKKATSSEFLQTRIDINKNSSNNFEHWSVNTMPRIPIESNILDLGCGTGKQIESFSSFLSDKTNYIGCDISSQSLDVVHKNYKAKPNLRLINDSFDNIDLFMEDTMSFDLIYSFYALYYTNDLEKLIKHIYKYLKKNGIFWIVMPYKNTNVEIFNILNKIYPIDEKVMYSIDGFSNDIISLASDVGFEDIDISLFENQIYFNHEEDILNYIQNTTFYDKDYAKEVSEAINKNFKDNFSLTKEVISIRLTK